MFLITVDFRGRQEQYAAVHMCWVTTLGVFPVSQYYVMLGYLLGVFPTSSAVTLFLLYPEWGKAESPSLPEDPLRGFSLVVHCGRKKAPVTVLLHRWYPLSHRLYRCRWGLLDI